MARIDVLLPVRNAQPYLGEAIDSVLNQTFVDWRLIVLDHGSTDGSAELVCRYAEQDKRITLLSRPDVPSLGGLLNLGLDAADASYIVRQDGDDISAPRRFATILELFSSEPDLLVVGANASVIDSFGRTIGRITHPRTPAAIKAASFFCNPFAHPALALNLCHINKLGARYGEDILRALPRGRTITVMDLAEDYFLFAQLAMLGPCRNVNLPLIKYRRHENSISTTRRIEQIGCGLTISRFLAASVAAISGTEEFDPAPFCSHGEIVFDCGMTDYSAEFDRISRSLGKALGPSAELTRELAFRRILSNRRTLSMTAAYTRFLKANGFRASEYRIVRNWLARFASGRNVLSVKDYSAGQQVALLR